MDKVCYVCFGRIGIRKIKKKMLLGYGRSGQPAKHSPHSLQLWFTRFALLIKLGLYELCSTESEPFGLLNRPDVYYEVC